MRRRSLAKNSTAAMTKSGQLPLIRTSRVRKDHRARDQLGKQNLFHSRMQEMHPSGPDRLGKDGWEKIYLQISCKDYIGPGRLFEESLEMVRNDDRGLG